MEPRTRPRIRSRKAIAAGRQAAGSIDDAKRMAQRWGFASSATARCGPRPVRVRPTGRRGVALATRHGRNARVPPARRQGATRPTRRYARTRVTCSGRQIGVVRDPNSNGRATQTHPQTPRSDRRFRRHRNSLRMHAQSAPTYAAPWPRSCNTCRAPVTCVATILSRVSKEVARSSDLADVHRLAVMRAEVLVLIATRVQGHGAQDILAPVGGSEARCNML